MPISSVAMSQFAAPLLFYFTGYIIIVFCESNLIDFLVISLLLLKIFKLVVILISSSFLK